MIFHRIISALPSIIKNKTVLISGAILLLPFIVFAWLLPGSPAIIGNDYPIFSIRFQMEYFYSILNGTFPLFIPDFWFGQTSAALSLAQIYHPVAWLTYIIPGYWEKDALLIYSMMKLISIGIANLVLYFFFIRMGLVKFLAFICSFVVIYNLRMLDLFRYGASLETYTGFILLVVSLEYLYRDTKRYSRRLFVIGSTYLVIVSGHPQMTYYALLGAGVFLLLLPVLLSNRKAHNPEPYKYIFLGLLLIFTGVLLSSIFIFPFYFEYLQNNTSRAQNPYTWTLGFASTPVDILNSFTVPFRANVHGAFGASSLFMVGIISAFLSKRFLTRISTISIVLVVIALLIVMAGDYGFLHKFLWNYFPLYSSFRIPARISLLVPFYIILLYALFLKYLLKNSTGNSILSIHIAITILFVFLSLVSIYYIPLTSQYASEIIRKVSTTIELVYVALNALLIILLGLYFSTNNNKNKSIFAVFSTIIVIISSALVLPNGTWLIPYKVAEKNILSLEEYKLRTNGLGKLGYGLESNNVRTQIANYKFDPEQARMLPAITYLTSLSEAYEYLNEYGDNKSVAIVSPGQQQQTKTLCDKNCYYRIILTCHTYNKFEYNLHNNTAGVIKFNIPYSNNWVATIDGIKAEILKANGFEMAIVIPNSGNHKLTLSYDSWSFVAGLIISLTTLTILFIIGIRKLKLNSYIEIVFIFLSISIAVGMVISRDDWLYKGKCLPQSYSWESH
jgi:hypothetical protein